MTTISWAYILHIQLVSGSVDFYECNICNCSVTSAYLDAHQDWHDSMLGFYSTSGVSKPTGYVNNYSTVDKTLANYTANNQGSAFSSTPLALLNAATLTDLNALRVAYENLRSFTEDAIQQHNQLVADLKNTGLIA